MAVSKVLTMAVRLAVYLGDLTAAQSAGETGETLAAPKALKRAAELADDLAFLMAD